MTEPKLIDKNASYINLKTGSYPISFATIKAENPNVLFGRKTPYDLLEMLGYSEIVMTERPEGQVVTAGVPEERDGVYYQTWVARDFTPEELAAQLNALKSATLDFAAEQAAACRERGAKFDFGEGVGINHVQLREVDISNLTGLGLKARHDLERQYFFRSYENTVIPLTGQQTVELTDFAFEAFEVFLAAYWTMQSQIQQAPDAESIPDEETIITTLWQAVGGQ